MSGHSWDEIGDRVYRLSCATYNLNVAVVQGEEGLLLIDTRSNLDEARELREEIAKLSPAPVRWVVNTHVHYDHTFGNAEFVPPRQVPGAQLWAHDNAIAEFDAYAESVRRELIAEGGAEAAAMARQVFAVPRHGFSRTAKLNLGSRQVELAYLGRGHTSGDIVLHVPDAGVVIAGDLIRQVGPPSHWADCFPLEWPETVSGLLRMGTASGEGDATVFLPGHGTVVDLAFVWQQYHDLAAVAAEVTRLYLEGVPTARAVQAGSWPYQSPRLQTAVERGYEALASASAGDCGTNRWP